MASLNDVVPGSSADSSCIQQIIDVLKGTVGSGNIPVSLTAVNDAANYGLDVQNKDTINQRAFRVRDSSGGARLTVDGSPSLVTMDGALISSATITNSTLTSPTISNPVLSGSGFSAFSSFNPSVTQGVGITLTINHANYTQIGKLVMVNLDVLLKSTGTAGNAIVLSGLPITPKRTTGTLGSGIYGQAVVGTYTVVAEFPGSANVNLRAQSSVGAGTNYLGINPTVTISSADNMRLTLLYEAN